MTLQVKLITQNGSGIESQADYVKIPGKTGECGIIQNHSPSLIQLKPGHIIIQNGKEKQVFFIESGLAHVLPDSVSILCSDYELASNIDYEKAKETRDKDLKILNEDPSEDEKLEVQNSLEKTNERIYICENLR